jgi:IS5 family transposase
MPTPSQLSFFDLAARYDALSDNGDPLESLATHVPWADFRPVVEPLLRRSKRQQGWRPPFDAVLMFKVLVLQALYNLSDDQTE